MNQIILMLKKNDLCYFRNYFCSSVDSQRALFEHYTNIAPVIIKLAL